MAPLPPQSGPNLTFQMINYALTLELTLEMHVLPMVKQQRGLLNQ